MPIVFLLIMFCLNAQAFLLNGTAARVGKHLITVEEAYFYRGMQRYFNVKSFKNPSPNPLSKVSNGEMKLAVDKIVFEQLVLEELNSLKMEKVPVSRAKARLNTRFKIGGSALWSRLLRRYHKSDSEALAIIRRSLSVEKFVKKKVETLTPIITQREVEQYLRQRGQTVSEKDMVKIGPSIENILKKQRVQKGMNDWIEFLKKKYEVTNFVNG